MNIRLCRPESSDDRGGGLTARYGHVLTARSQEVSMAQHEAREIGCYLRNGSLWVGRFVANSTDLYFGDDRFNAMHGLARVAYAEPAGSANPADLQVHACTRSSNREDPGKTSNVANVDGRI